MVHCSDAAPEQQLHGVAAEPDDLLHGADAVGRMERVSVVQKILMRQHTDGLAQHADAAETGIKKCDGQGLVCHAARLLLLRICSIVYHISRVP